MNLALTCWFCQCCNTTILFYLLIIKPTLYNRIRLFISEWDGRCDCLHTTAEQDIVWIIWGGDDAELSCAHLNGEWQFHAKYHELIGAFLACPPDWAQGRPLLRDDRSLSMPGCQTTVSVLRILFSRLSMLPSFQPMSGNSLNSLPAPYAYWFDR